MLILNVKKCQLRKGEITQAYVKIPSDLLIFKKEKKEEEKTCYIVSSLQCRPVYFWVEQTLSIFFPECLTVILDYDEMKIGEIKNLPKRVGVREKMEGGGRGGEEKNLFLPPPPPCPL